MTMVTKCFILVIVPFQIKMSHEEEFEEEEEEEIDLDSIEDEQILIEMVRFLLLIILV